MSSKIVSPESESLSSFPNLTFPPLPPLSINERIQHQTHRGTIRYIGNIPSKGLDQVWIGIEWDDPGRGKHNGSVNGEQFFTTIHATGGSFLKLEILELRTVYLLEAVLKRYVKDARDLEYKKERHLVGGVGGVVEFRVGVFGEKIEILERIDVGGMGVRIIEKGVGDVLKGVRELRIGKGLFSEINVVDEILDEFDRLRVLDLNGNLLRGVGSGGPVYAGLKELILNGCTVSVEGVGGVCSRAIGIEELRLHGCGLGGLGRWKGGMERVEVLDLDGNCVEWEDVVEVLGKMGELRELYLSRNGLKDCKIGFGEGRFGKLERLSLGWNELDGWEVVEGLTEIRGLKWLRLEGNGCMENGEKGVEGRMVAIGRLARLEVLDASFIEKDERVYAERRYLLGVIENVKREVGEEEVRRRHGRVLELRAKYEDLEGRGRQNEREGGVRRGLVKVVLKRGKELRGKGKEEVIRWMPSGVKMDRVRAVAERLLRIEEFGSMQVVVENRWDIVADQGREIAFWIGNGQGNPCIQIICG